MAHVEADGDRTLIEPLDPWHGLVLKDRYRIGAKLAAGGFGSVYTAFDVVGQREVAVKLLHPALAADPSIAARFLREIEALATLTSPHTVAALDAGEAPDGTPFLVMELLTGESVYDQMKARGKMPWRRVVAIARGVCHSLAEAHARGIVHRDLKPENIHLESRGDDLDFVKVLDFGIAKNRFSAVEGGADLTMVGQMIGTYCYMAPEQMIGTCTAESDIFTLGIVLYELIAGRRPYGDAKGPAAQLAAVLGDTPPPLTGVPVAFAEIVARCIDKDPLRRYRDAGELGDALAKIGDNADEQPTTFAPHYRTPPHGSHTIHGVVPARGSAPVFERPRMASGTSPIVEPVAQHLAPPRPVTETGQIYDPNTRRTILISLAIAALAIALGLLL